MKRTLVAVAIAVVFVLALAAPALAQMTHTAAYELDGTINFEKQAGHKCNTGAEIKQTISGNGVMSKTQTVTMRTGIITMVDDNEWVAGATPLTVTTVWDLCAPGKHVYDGSVIGVDGDAVPLDQLYGALFDDNTAQLAGMSQLTDQIWAVQVQADPGFSGELYQDGVAAYGDYKANSTGAYLPLAYDSTDDDWKYAGYASNWTFGLNKYSQPAALIGPNFVGNYFNMDQHARTSMGTQRRYISLSSPFSHAYVTEDMSVVGKSDITDSLAMLNAPSGADVTGDWWKLF